MKERKKCQSKIKHKTPSVSNVGKTLREVGICLRQTAMQEWSAFLSE